MKSSADADARDALFGIPNNNERIDRMAEEVAAYFTGEKELAAAKAELVEAKKKYLQVCAQHGRLVDQVYEDDGETLKQDSLQKDLAEANRLVSYNATDSLKWRTLYQNERDNHDATLTELVVCKYAIEQALDDMATDYCVCPAAKDQLQRAIKGSAP